MRSSPRTSRPFGVALLACWAAVACTKAARPGSERALVATSATPPGGGELARLAGPSAPPPVRSPAEPTPDTSTPPTPDAPLDAEPPLPAFEAGPGAVASTEGIVVAVEKQAAQVGAQVLARGGNAVDAAVATVLALSVTHSSAASLGGGGFALVRSPHGPTLAFDFRENAPSALDRRGFDAMQQAGGHGKDSVGVPGLVAGLAAIHERAGSRPFSDLVEPAIALAEKGFIVGRWEAELFRMRSRDLKADASLRRTFFKNNKPPEGGARIVQPELAWTLKRLRDGGADAFYRGDIAQRLAKALVPRGPSLDDLAKYRCIERSPLATAYRGYVIETMPPPSAGGVALVGTLALLANVSRTESSSADAIHYLLEAQRRAQAERRLGVIDPDLLDPSESERRRGRWLSSAFWLTSPITAEATPSGSLRQAPAEAEREAEHTTHVSVVDREGTVVSLTTTLSASFGAQIAAAGTGIVLNNAVASFSSSGENQPRASARTTSSMAPTLVLSAGEVRAVLGTPGGDTIPSTLGQIISHLVDERLSLQAAVEAPRWHQAFLPDQARYEPELRTSPVLPELRRRGHKLRALGRRFGDANCVVLDHGKAYGYADSREPGVAIPGGR